MANQFPSYSGENRSRAKTLGHKTYISGTACKKCGSYEKYTKGCSCYPCGKRNGLKKLLDKELMAPYRSKERDKLRLERWRLNNPEKVKEQRKRVRTKQASHQQIRRARIKNQFPENADVLAIQTFYLDAAKLTKETGIIHEVDHELSMK